MRGAALLGVFVVAAVAAVPAAGTARQAKVKEIKKGDKVILRGCLSGSALDATDIEGVDGGTGIAIGLTFRLTGDKKLIKQLRDEQSARVVTLQGVLKSDLRSETGQTANVGGVRIGIGKTTSVPGRPDAESQRSYPVLEVKSFEGSTITCGR